MVGNIEMISSTSAPAIDQEQALNLELTLATT
jgi:hypothetical protein